MTTAPAPRKISPELIQAIKQKVNILEVVGEHVVLRKTGANHVGLCPFHSERSPSFSVSESKQLFHCYGCKAGGDLVSFLVDLHGISFSEAIEELAHRAGVAIPELKREGKSTGKSDPHSDQARLAHRLNRFVAAFFRQQLAKAASAKAYLSERGVTPELESEFYVGYAPSDWDALSIRLKNSGAPIELAAQLGLVRESPPGKSRNGVSTFDLFRHRVIFPILDQRGHVAGFGGRLLEGDGPKYLNSPESFLFHKSRLAFGLYQARKHIRELDELILVEGYFDVLGLHRAGFKNAVATCGTSLTTEHLAIFQRLTSRIIVLFDGDEAGVNAMEKAMITGLNAGVVLFGVTLPDGQDPDEFLEGGPERAQQLRDWLASAQPILDVKIAEAAARSTQNPEAKAQAIKQVASWLGQLSDPIGRDLRVGSSAKLFGIPEDLLRRAISGVAEPKARGPQAANVSSGRRPSSPRMDAARGLYHAPPGRLHDALPGRSDRLLIRGWAQWGQTEPAWKEIQAALPPGATVSDLFQHPMFRQLSAGSTASAVASGSEFGASRMAAWESELLSNPSVPAQVRSAITEALFDAAPVDLAELRMVLKRRLGRTWARFSQKLRRALAEAEAQKNVQLHEKLLAEYLDVQRKMKDFNTFSD